MSEEEASELEDLRALNRLKGKLKVVIRDGYKYDKQGKEGGYLSNKEHLIEIEIQYEGRVEGDEEALLEGLKPHCNIKRLYLQGYRGVRIPRLAKVEGLYTYSLREMILRCMPNVKSMSGIGLEHFTALETLHLYDLSSLRLDDDDEEEGMPWRGLHHCLRRLELYRLPKMDKLPKAMQHLTSLRSLDIISEKYEGGVPEWIGCLSSLQFLRITSKIEVETMPTSMQQLTSLANLIIRPSSEKLHKRCQSPNGEDWPLIRHIPRVNI